MLGFATGALQALNETKPGKERKLYLAGGGELVFVLQPEQLSVASSISGKSASTQIAEALNAFRAGDVNGLVPCKPASARDAKCRDQFVQGFGLRAFRRPLSDVELRRYAALFRMAGRWLASHASPCAMVPSCMSWIRLGVMNENAGTALAARSVASWVYGASWLAHPDSFS